MTNYIEPFLFAGLFKLETLESKFENYI